MRRHLPLLSTLAASTAAYAAVLVVSAPALAAGGGRASWLLALVAGGVYAHFFEFWAHRYPMHRKLPLMRAVRLSHLRHHRTFHGDRFRTRSAADLQNVAGRWWRFPMLLLGHFVVLGVLLPIPIVATFLMGCLAHYLFFEVTHWFTHVEDNAFDRFAARIPWIAGVRARQIEHHRLHHERPDVAFNFNPPYLGDRLAGLMPPPAEPELAVASAGPSAAPRPVSASRMDTWGRPLLRYGSALLIGGAVVGLAVVAHARWSEGRLPLVARNTESRT